MSSEFYCLNHPDSGRLRGRASLLDGGDLGLLCPVNARHRLLSAAGRNSRVNRHIAIDVKHNRRDESMIWPWAAGYCVVHESVVEAMHSRGFTGFECRPATVRFRDGELSREYCRLLITGWAGLARPESGVRLLEGCSSCVWKKYSPLIDPSQLIDENQWTGDDFFMVWPATGWTFVTSRVVEFLASARVKSYKLDRLEPAGPGEENFTGGNEFQTDSLEAVLPTELALKYGPRLGLL